MIIVIVILHNDSDVAVIFVFKYNLTRHRQSVNWCSDTERNFDIFVYCLPNRHLFDISRFIQTKTFSLILGKYQLWQKQ